MGTIRGLSLMKNIRLNVLVILSLLLVTFASIASPKRYQNDSYVMQEPFSSAPLITYPSLEAGVDS